MTEKEARAAVVAEAMEWRGTPYKLNGRIKGVGCNCAQLLYGVAIGSGAIPSKPPEPRWYSPQLHVHSKDERLIEYFKSYGAVQVKESEIQDGDIVLYRSGKS